MSRYKMLVRVLDGIRNESVGTKFEARYAVGALNIEDVWQARSRAYIHLYLKVMFGIDRFEDREAFVTDGGRDGGVDGYYIDQDAHEIYILQSKFRHSAENFESKPIELNELLAMQVKRILSGEEIDEQGHNYNGKILGLQRRLKEIFDIGRYNYKVVILANLKNVSDEALCRLTDNMSTEVIDYELSYSKLLYPVLSGTLFKAKGLGIWIDLSNKSTGGKINYSVSAEDVDCEITVVFVPTIEIARIMSAYKNSILTYNPRSYLEFQGEKVNEAIRNSILKTRGNDFALLNNGITIICDESGVNEQSGRKNKAQLFLLNPQIINGGQTAYTLCRIYEDSQPSEREGIFEGKEVMVKAIAVEVSDTNLGDRDRRIRLIEKISTATNSQTNVSIADRESGDPLNIEMQKVLFHRYGLLYERKRGEFGEGLRNKYIRQPDIINRTHFARLYFTANGTLSKALKSKLPIRHLPRDVAENLESLDQFAVALAALETLRGERALWSKAGYVSILPRVRAAVIAAAHLSGGPAERGRVAAALVRKYWPRFLEHGVETNSNYVRIVVDPNSKTQTYELRSGRKSVAAEFEPAAKQFFENLAARYGESDGRGDFQPA